MNDDFDNLAWHDSKVYSIVFPNIDNSLNIDIDFIIEWVENEDSCGFNFLVAPAILRFENISNLSIRIDLNDLAELFIDEVKKINCRLSPNGNVLLYDFNIVLNVGEISFTSTGFKQEYTNVPQIGKEQTYNRK